MLAASSEPVFSSFTATAAPWCVNAHTLPKKPLPSLPSPSTGLRSARLSPRPSANNKSNAGTRNLASTTTAAAAAAGGAHTRPSGHTCRRTNKHRQTCHKQGEHHSRQAHDCTCCCWQAVGDPKRTPAKRVAAGCRACQAASEERRCPTRPRSPHTRTNAHTRADRRAQAGHKALHRPPTLQRGLRSAPTTRHCVDHNGLAFRLPATGRK